MPWHPPPLARRYHSELVVVVWRRHVVVVRATVAAHHAVLMYGHASRLAFSGRSNTHKMTVRRSSIAFNCRGKRRSTKAQRERRNARRRTQPDCPQAPPCLPPPSRTNTATPMTAIPHKTLDFMRVLCVLHNVRDFRSVLSESWCTIKEHDVS